MLLPMDFDLATIIAALAGAGGWGIVHVLTKRRNGNGHKTDLNERAANMLQFDNDRLRQENSFLRRDNDDLKERVLKLEKQVDELELKIRLIEGKI